MVTNIQIGGKTVAVNHSRFLGTNAETLMVQADANSMVVEFAALDFTAADHNRYAYRLDGFDKDWIENRRYAPLSRLHQLAARRLSSAFAWLESQRSLVRVGFSPERQSAASVVSNLVGLLFLSCFV